MKAETSDSEPTEADRPNKEAARATHNTPDDKVKNSNPTQLGDHTSLKAETSDSQPTKDDRGAKGVSEERVGGSNNGKPKM